MSEGYTWSERYDTAEPAAANDRITELEAELESAYKTINELMKVIHQMTDNSLD